MAQKRVDEAAHGAAAIEAKLQEEQRENRQAYERFHNNLAVIAGGTIALSVTYLGYLKTLSRPVYHQALLMASWAVLLLCVIGSVFYSFFYAHYLYYARMKEYGTKRKDLREKEADALPYMNLMNVQSLEEKAALEQRLRKAASDYSPKVESMQKWERFYFFLWKWGGRVSRMSFVVGLALLLSFAAVNT